MKRLTIAFLIVVLHSTVDAGVQEVVFIGITGDGAPAIENTFELQLRKRLSTQSSLYLADCIVSQRYARMIKFNYYPVVSRELVESIESFATDTTLFVWGTVKRCDVTTVRKNFLKTAVKGVLEINLTVYSLDTKNYSYSGVIFADVEEPGKYSLFADQKKSSHVDAIKRQEVLQKCIDEAVTKTTAMINALVQKNVGEKTTVPENVEENKVPSIYDVFTVPSVKAREVNEENKPAEKKEEESEK
ncbi:MAG: hypothetical protein JW915_24870 [Chitinispirillaceae bacterium]|nr:hypothetical protein [Chitinispirillaceae bacterium]